MATALTSKILNQRSKFSQFAKFQRGTRAATFASKVSSLNSKTQQAEDANIISMYQDGLISNDEYLAYLGNMAKRTTTSASDKVEILNTIRDTKQKIEVEALEADYNIQPDRSPAKANAAAKLGQYWASNAESLVPGTPAYSNAMAQQGKWSQQSVAITNASQVDNRKAMRTAREMQISGMDESKSDLSMAKAQMFADLASQAVQDGDMVDAQKYQTLSNNAVSKAETLQTTEQKKTALQELAWLKNDWHDGSVSYEEAIAKLNQINDIAINTGDATLANMVNTQADAIYKDNTKNIGRVQIGNLSIVTSKKKGGGSDIGGLAGNRTAEQSEDDYIGNMRDLQASIEKGDITREDAEVKMMKYMTDRYNDLKEIEMAAKTYQDQGNRKMWYQGVKTNISTVLKEVQSELTGDANNPFGERLKYTPIPKKMGLEAFINQNKQLAEAISAEYPTGEVADLNPEDVNYLKQYIDPNSVSVLKSDGTVERVLKDIKFTKGKYIQDADGYYREVKNAGQIKDLVFESKEDAKAHNEQYFGGYGDIIKNEDGSFGLSISSKYVQAGDDLNPEIWVRNKLGEWLPVDKNTQEAIELAKINNPDSVQSGLIYTTEQLGSKLPTDENEIKKLLEKKTSLETGGKGLFDYISPTEKTKNIVKGIYNFGKGGVETTGEFIKGKITGEGGDYTKAKESFGKSGEAAKDYFKNRKQKAFNVNYPQLYQDLKPSLKKAGEWYTNKEKYINLLGGMSYKGTEKLQERRGKLVNTVKTLAENKPSETPLFSTENPLTKNVFKPVAPQSIQPVMQSTRQPVQMQSTNQSYNQFQLQPSSQVPLFKPATVASSFKPAIQSQPAQKNSLVNAFKSNIWTPGAGEGKLEAAVKSGASKLKNLATSLVPSLFKRK